MRLSVQTKLLAGFGVVVLLMLAVGLFAVSRLGSDNRHLSRIAGEVVPSTRAVGDINALMNKYRKDQLHYIVARPSDRPLGVPGSIAGDLAEDLTKLHAALRSYKDRGLVEDAPDQRLLDTFGSEFAGYVAASAAFAPLADRGRTLQAGEAIGDGPGDHAWDALKTLIGKWNDHKVQTAHAAEAASHASYRSSIRLILGLLALAVALAAAVAVILARRTRRAVREIGVAAKAIAQGDIDQRVPVRGNDELGEMASDFDTMIDYLRGTVVIAESIAAGDLDVEVRPRSERDALGRALSTMTDSLRRLAADNERLLAASREEAHTDALTGLPNRRALMRDLEARLADAADTSLILALFDLDGFKHYNDTFGHPAGDALLARLGDRLQRAVDGSGSAYRMGGDEFCVLAPAGSDGGAAIARQAADALSERGEAFAIGCSHGIARLPEDARSSETALGVADQRMYDRKSGRASASRQSTDVLLRALSERTPGLPEHIGQVAELAARTAERLGLPEHEVKRIQLAAELHDVGKVAIPDAILAKPGPLDAEEWEFMRRHSEIGERIVIAAPSLAHTAELVRSHHERHDGSGYPDQLTGEQIPLGARIIAVCDAFDAMTSTRPYSNPRPVADALAELRRCAGTQFHPDVVQAFGALIEHAEPTVARAA